MALWPPRGGRRSLDTTIGVWRPRTPIVPTGISQGRRTPTATSSSRYPLPEQARSHGRRCVTITPLPSTDSLLGSTHVTSIIKTPPVRSRWPFWFSLVSQLTSHAACNQAAHQSHIWAASPIWMLPSQHAIAVGTAFAQAPLPSALFLVRLVPAASVDGVGAPEQKAKLEEAVQHATPTQRTHAVAQGVRERDRVADEYIDVDVRLSSPPILRENGAFLSSVLHALVNGAHSARKFQRLSVWYRVIEFTL